MPDQAIKDKTAIVGIGWTPFSRNSGVTTLTLAAEASRQAAWEHFDQDNHTAASRYFETALRASATANDPVTGAYTLSFLAVQCYSTGEAQQAVSLLDTARGTVAGLGSRRMAAMLAARSARALQVRPPQGMRPPAPRGPHRP